MTDADQTVVETSTHAAETSEAAGRALAPGYVWLLVVGLAGAAAAIALPGILDAPDLAVPGLVGLALLPVFALAEVVVIHLPTQRNAHGHTLREVPAIVGLTFLAPQEYVVVYVIGAVTALAVWTRMGGVKLAFNASLFAFEAAFGAFLYHLLLQGGDPLAPLGWLAALVTVLTIDLISAGAVTAAISLTEGAFDGGVLEEALRSGVAAACINTCVALIVTTLVTVRPEAVALLVVIVGLLVLGYRVYIQLARGHARTQLLYRFVERTASAQAMDDVVQVVLREAGDLMYAESAYLLELPETTAEGGEPGRMLCHALVDGRVVRTPLTRPAGATPWWLPAVEGSSVLLPSRTQDSESDAGEVSGQTPSALIPAAPRDAVAAPLRGGGGILGVLAVCDRSFEKETFGPEDLQVFETLAAHAVVAVERATTVNSLERMAEQRAYDALHDPLSGLPNRRAFNEALVDTMQPDHPGGVVLLLDLDDFKDVNDTLGHSAGDRLITVSGDRLRDHARGLVSRLGGDEFAVLLPGMSVEEGLGHAAELHTALSRPVPLGEVELIVSASIGVAEIDRSVSSAEDLLAQADVAMYTAKADRSGVALYRPEAGDSTARRLALAADLPNAIADGSIHLWYQPQADARTGVVTGFEALMRWRHPTFGMVPPPEIIAVAHRTGRIRQLTDGLIRLALEARLLWVAAGHHDLSVSVNVTPGDVADPALVTRIELELTRTGTPPSGLVIEVTESDAMKDPELSLDTLSKLRDLGVQVAVDDFGTGYSSLAYLDQLPVNEVKIDRSFVVRLERGAADSTIVNATVALAHDLGLRVVAEGVESDLARTMVCQLGVDLYQGYGLGRPMPEDDVLPWLVAHEATVVADLPSIEAWPDLSGAPTG